jgi:hypothetical protein
LYAKSDNEIRDAESQQPLDAKKFSARNYLALNLAARGYGTPQQAGGQKLK